MTVDAMTDKENTSGNERRLIQSLQQWQRPLPNTEKGVAGIVADLINSVRQDGDAAIKAASEKFDGFAPQVIPLQPFDSYDLPIELKQATGFAAERIETFARFQMESYQSRSYQDEYGEFGQRVTPLERIGAYVPGGRFPLISTALMTLIPAKVAGVPERIVCSPTLNEAVLAAASLAGATRFIRLGGAQAIAALSYGSCWNEAVDRIVGPGNAFVAEAKAQLQFRTPIDAQAGPSEVLILADDLANSEWLAWDMLAQAEHDPDALAVCVSDSESLLRSVEQQLAQLSESQVPSQCQLLLADSVQDMVAFSNRFAAEHLMLCHNDISEQQLTHYGALFQGEQSAVALGDYCSGPNHTLPTAGNARQSAGLSVGNFLKVQTFQKVAKNAGALCQNACVLAKAEGLTAHAASLLARM